MSRCRAWLTPRRASPPCSWPDAGLRPRGRVRSNYRSAHPPAVCGPTPGPTAVVHFRRARRPLTGRGASLGDPSTPRSSLQARNEAVDLQGGRVATNSSEACDLELASARRSRTPSDSTPSRIRRRSSGMFSGRPSPRASRPLLRMGGSPNGCCLTTLRSPASFRTSMSEAHASPSSNCTTTSNAPSSTARS